MKFVEFFKSRESHYPYRVVIEDVDFLEVQHLSNRLGLDIIRTVDHPDGRLGDILSWHLIEFGLKHSNVLLPAAGAVGKSVLDVLVDRVKTWLATRPGNRKVVVLFGPDNEVVQIVKTGKEIRTSNQSSHRSGSSSA